MVTFETKTETHAEPSMHAGFGYTNLVLGSFVCVQVEELRAQIRMLQAVGYNTIGEDEEERQEGQLEGRPSGGPMQPMHSGCHAQMHHMKPMIPAFLLSNAQQLPKPMQCCSNPTPAQSHPRWSQMCVVHAFMQCSVLQRLMQLCSTPALGGRKQNEYLLRGHKFNLVVSIAFKSAACFQLLYALKNVACPHKCCMPSMLAGTGDLGARP